jgi:hypothetical protein
VNEGGGNGCERAGSIKVDQSKAVETGMGSPFAKTTASTYPDRLAETRRRRKPAGRRFRLGARLNLAPRSKAACCRSCSFKMSKNCLAVASFGRPPYLIEKWRENRIDRIADWRIDDFMKSRGLVPQSRRSRGSHGAKGTTQESPDTSGLSSEARHPSPLERPSSWHSARGRRFLRRFPNDYRPIV